MSLLEVENLCSQFSTKRGIVKAVDGVSFTLNEGESLALVGESGSGKSVTALSLMRLLDEGGRTVEGAVRYRGNNLLTLSEDKMRRIRGRDISMIFQEPMTSLNPVFRVGAQIEEILILHEGLNNTSAKKRAIGMLEKTGFSDGADAYRRYPHELSGGMRQRVMIAIALACRPKILIADEPTTALDVTIQAQILTLIKDLQKELGTALLLITHDLGIVSESADRVAVMYHGKIVEQCSANTLFNKGPSHPYTSALLGSAQSMKPIEGTVPSPFDVIKGCSFAPRCPFAQSQCLEQLPCGECACFYPLKGGN